MKKRKSACPISTTILLAFIFLTMLTACNSGEQPPNNEAILIQEDAIIGEWVYTDDTLIYYFDGEGNYAMADSVDIFYGGYDFDGKTILLDDGSGVIQSGYFDFSEGGHLYLEGMDGNFFYVGESSLSAHLEKMGKTPYFEELGISTDFMPGEGRHTLNNGGVYYYENGSGYTTVPVEYAIEITDDIDKGDGYREVNLTIKTYFSSADVPLVGSFIFSRLWDFADYYTGYILPSNDAFEKSHIGDNVYTFRFPFQGEEIEITITQNDTTYDYNIGDSYVISTNNFVVRMPVEYDGLVYCAESFPGTFEAMNAMTDESKNITELQELNDYFYFDPYTGLFCRIY